MSFKNDKKGYYGNFSKSGKKTTMNNLILSKEELKNDNFAKKQKRKGPIRIEDIEDAEKKNLLREAEFKQLNAMYISKDFNYNEKNKILEKDVDKNKMLLNKEGVDIFERRVIKKDIRKNNSGKDNSKIKNIISKSSSNLLSKQEFKIANQIIPLSTQYDPNYEAIIKRSCSVPKLDTKLKEHTVFDVYEDGKIKDIKENMEGNSLIEMDKQSVRQNFRRKTDAINAKDKDNIEPRHNKTHSTYLNKIKNLKISFNESEQLEKVMDEKNNINNTNSKLNDSNANSNSPNFHNKTVQRPTTALNRRYSNKNSNLTFRGKLTENNDDSDSPNDSYELYKDIYTKEIKKAKYASQKRQAAKSARGKKLKSKKEEIKAIDFEKIITHEYLNKISDSHVAVIPYLLPNYTAIRPDQNTMVVYDRKKHKINRNKADNLAKDSNAIYFDADKVLEKINNHKVIHPPNFDLMFSRPDDDDPLPSYMKKIFARNSCYEMTAQSLKLNNYSQCGFQNSKSSFFPKISYNKIINLNLLRSKKFLDEVLGDKKNLTKKHFYLGKALKFYNKNYEKIMNENYLSRFDCVTYKTIKNDKIVDIQKIIDELAENKA